MKNFVKILTLVLVLIGNRGFSQGINFFHGTYEEAVKKAKAENKIIFMDAYASWCGPCKWMSANVFTTQEVGAFHNANFINLKMDMEKGEGPSLRAKFPLNAYPTLFWIAPDGKIVHKFVGAAQPDKLIVEGQTAMKGFDGSAALKKKYDEGDRSPETIYELIKSMNLAGIPSQKITNDYINAHKNLTDDWTLKIIQVGAIGADSKAFELLLKNREAITKLVGAETVSNQISIACHNTIGRASEFQDLKMLNDLKDLYKKEKLDNYGCFVKKADMLFYEKSKNTEASAKATLAYVASCETNEKVAIQNLIGLSAKNPTDANLQKKVTSQINKVLKKSTSEEILMTAAQWYIAKGDKKNALKNAEKALSLNAKTKQPNLAIQKFIDSIKTS